MSGGYYYHGYNYNYNYILLVASTQDLAGVTMSDYLRQAKGFSPGSTDAADTNNATAAAYGRKEGGMGGELFASPLYPNVLLYLSGESLLHLENLDGLYPGASAYIFLSKHRSDSGIPTLTCHCTGNFAGNPYGGNEREIAISYPSLQKEYLRAITAEAKARAPGYDVVIEATHHGPTSLKKPVLFVELGSSEKQWGDRNAASAICDSLLAVVGRGRYQQKSAAAAESAKSGRKVGVALGGTHYPAKFNRLLLDSEFCLAAVASKHSLEAVDESMLAQMIAKSVEPVTHVILDAKGLGSHKDRITALAERTGLEILKV